MQAPSLATCTAVFTNELDTRGYITGQGVLPGPRPTANPVGSWRRYGDRRPFQNPFVRPFLQIQKEIVEVIQLIPP